MSRTELVEFAAAKAEVSKAEVGRFIRGNPNRTKERRKSNFSWFWNI